MSWLCILQSASAYPALSLIFHNKFSLFWRLFYIQRTIGEKCVGVDLCEGNRKRSWRCWRNTMSCKMCRNDTICSDSFGDWLNWTNAIVLLATSFLQQGNQNTEIEDTYAISKWITIRNTTFEWKNRKEKYIINFWTLLLYVIF